MQRLVLLINLLALSGAALAFCGFYVAKADTELFNRSSKVIIARDGPRTILSMANDFSGDVSEFAMVVPIPYVFEPEQIQVGDPDIFARIDAYSAPRLVEYHDPDPCAWYETDEVRNSASLGDGRRERFDGESAAAFGVTIEASFDVGEYDILILGAEQSDGLETWLLDNGYQLPAGASEALAPYIARDMKFFVARVDLAEHAAGGYRSLRPLLMAFESEEFMLPIQLGKVNAAGEQDLVIYLLSPQGRIEVANYPTVPIPSNVTVPAFVEDAFGDVYRSVFATAHAQHGFEAVLTEYAWDMAWCDPCAADPLSFEELRAAGVFWLEQGGSPNVFLTRLHLRYDATTFGEDLVFRVTDDRSNFQGRYVMQHPFEGALSCEQGRAYAESVAERQQQEARTLARLTGWDLSAVRARIEPYRPDFAIPNWWQRVFDRLDLP